MNTTAPKGTESSTADVIAFIRHHTALKDCAAGQAWLVGGFVRDALLGRFTNDLDVIVPAGGTRLARAIGDAFGGASFVLDQERDVGRAIVSQAGGELPPPGERGPLGESLRVDVARLRAPDLLTDLSLRDFTINAMAVDVGAAESSWGECQAAVIDPFGGRADLDRRVIRAVTEGAFRDDPLRTLRGIRQSVELGFRLEDGTFDLIRRDSHLLDSVAAERIRDELVRIVSVPGAWQHLRLLDRADLLRPILPEVAALIGVSQTPPHYQDVFDHTRSVIAHLEGIQALLWPEGTFGRRPTPAGDDATVIAHDAMWADLAEVVSPYRANLCAHLLLPLSAERFRRDALFWAALAHDWGKPAMRTSDENGRARFLEHDLWGALLAQARLQALKFSGDEIAYVGRLVDLHMRPAYLAHDYPPSRRSIYRFFRDAAGTGPDCILLSAADHMATWAPGPDAERWRKRLATMQLLFETYFREREERVEPAPLLDGRQIMAEFGLRPGPQIGELLEGLREAQATGEVTNTDQAIAWLTERVHQP